MVRDASSIGFVSGTDHVEESEEVEVSDTESTHDQLPTGSEQHSFLDQLSSFIGWFSSFFGSFSSFVWFSSFISWFSLFIVFSSFIGWFSLFIG